MQRIKVTSDIDIDLQYYRLSQCFQLQRQCSHTSCVAATYILPFVYFIFKTGHT